jgi:Flp pilus assembly protein TadD
MDRPNEKCSSREVLVSGHLDAALGDEPASDQAVPAEVLDMTAVRDAMDRREFDRATELLDRMLDTHPDDATVLALLGRLLECRGLNHSAYHEYRRALAIDPENVEARASMRLYCARFGLDADNPRVNPAAGR